MKRLLLFFLLMQLAFSGMQAQDNKYRLYYLESVVQREKENYASQYELLRQALAINPDAPEVLFDLAQVAQKSNLMGEDEILALYRKAIEKDGGKNEYYKEQFARYSVAVANYEEALPIFQKLAENTTKRDAAYEMICAIYEQSEQYDKLLASLEEWEKKGGDAETLSHARLKTLDKLQRYDDEIALLNRLIKDHDGCGSELYMISKAETLLQKGDTIEAWKTYEEALKISPDNPSAQMFPVLYYQAVKNYPKMKEAMEAVIFNNEQPSELRVSLMKNMIGGSEKNNGEAKIIELFDTLMQQPLKERALPDLYADFLASKHKKNEAFLPCMKKILEIDPADDQSRLVVVDDGLRHRNYEDVINKCKEGILLNPSKLVYYQIAGGSLYQLKRIDESLEIFGQGLKQTKFTKDSEILSDFYSSYADALHEGKLLEKAYEYYDSALVYNPTNVVTLNNYAYFLSVDEKYLDKALKMSGQVLKIEPDNPTYIDTYAWILFQQGNYEQARTYIEDALSKMGAGEEDANLYEHAGDIYIQLGQKKEAKDAWKTALKLGADNKVLIKKKIKSGKYIKQ